MGKTALKSTWMKFGIASLIIAAGIAKADPTTDRIASTGVLNIGYSGTNIPLSYSDAQGQPAGFFVDVCKQVAQAIQKRQGDKPISITFIPQTSQTRFVALQGERTDLDCTGMADTPLRRGQVAFSLTPFVSEVRFLTKKGMANSQDVKSALAGKAVATISGTTSSRAVRTFSSMYAVSIQQADVRSYEDAFAKLESGEVAAVVADDWLMAKFVAGSAAPHAYTFMGEPLAKEPLAIAMRKGDVDLAGQVNQALSDMFRSGQMAKIYAATFEGTLPGHTARMAHRANGATAGVWKMPTDEGFDAVQTPLTREIRVAAEQSSNSGPAQLAPTPRPAYAMPADEEPATPKQYSSAGMLGTLAAIAKGASAVGGKNSANLAMVSNALQGNSVSTAQVAVAPTPNRSVSPMQCRPLTARPPPRAHPTTRQAGIRLAQRQSSATRLLARSPITVSVNASPSTRPATGPSCFS